MNAFLEYLVKYVQLLRISDLIDILIVSVIVYYLINLIRETRAMQLVKGIIFLFIAFFLSQWLKLNALKLYFRRCNANQCICGNRNISARIA